MGLIADPKHLLEVNKNEFDLKLIEWIDSQWHDIAYNYHGRNRFSYWN